MRAHSCFRSVPAALLLSLSACTAGNGARGFDSAGGVARYDVVWNEPGGGPADSMPLGNGDVTLNVWTEANGDLLFYVGKSDSWGDNGRLLKVGRLRLSFDRPAPEGGSPVFRQHLDLERATVRVTHGDGPDRIEIAVWVDANHPTVIVEVESAEPIGLLAAIEPWRTQPETLPAVEVSDVLRGLELPTVVEPDVLLSDAAAHDPPARIGWYHHNRRSVGPALTARAQGTQGYPRPDPLLHRTFGAVLTAERAIRMDAAHLKSERSTRHRLALHVLTQEQSSPEQWLAAADRLIETTEKLPIERRRADHANWWRAFWERSWIHVTEGRPRSRSPLVPENDHPARIGEDQQGHNRFAGEFGRVSIFNGGLSDERILELAGERGVLAPASDPALYSGVPRPGDRPAGIDSEAIGQGLTVEAWIKSGARTGRIFDRIQPGGQDGLLFDLHPAGHLRAICGKHTLASEAASIPADAWTHVALSIDARSLRLYQDGRKIAEHSLEQDGLDDAFVVSRAYALQRFLTACAGRGRYPIKFNGSTLTVPHPGAPGDADYRRWGPGYWWQNTRLPYLGLCTAGDYDLLRPLFRMYADELLPLFRYRTMAYFGHEGAFIPECIYFWGDVFTETYGSTPFLERADKLQESGWHKWEWVSGPELVWMMLEYYDHTRDRAFLRDTLLPAAHEILTFFDQHYAVGTDGRLELHPAQALETWWDCTNPMPEVAGLRAVTEGLLALPDALTEPDERSFWNAFWTKLPELPTRTVDGVEMLAPAAAFRDKRNIENPELYAVFPFRRIAVGKPRLELGLAALEHRLDRGSSGWRQDDLFMATLGLAEAARKNLVERARTTDPGSRFPGFFGPNYDWVPDQDHGGVLVRTLQLMLLQSDRDQLRLLPAWPPDWDVSFRLHAPGGRVVEGEASGGKLHLFGT